MAKNSTAPETPYHSVVVKNKTAKKKAKAKKSSPKTAVKNKTVKKKSAAKNVGKKKAVAKKVTTKKTRPETERKIKTQTSNDDKRMMIAVHAYYKWEQAGRPADQDAQHWIEAENEIEAAIK